MASSLFRASALALSSSRLEEIDLDRAAASSTERWILRHRHGLARLGLELNHAAAKRGGLDRGGGISSVGNCIFQRHGRAVGIARGAGLRRRGFDGTGRGSSVDASSMAMVPLGGSPPTPSVPKGASCDRCRARIHRLNLGRASPQSPRTLRRKTRCRLRAHSSAPRVAPAAPPGFVRFLVAMSASPFAAAPRRALVSSARRGASAPADRPPRRLPSRFTRVVTAARRRGKQPGFAGIARDLVRRRQGETERTNPRPATSREPSPSPERPPPRPPRPRRPHPPNRSP